MNNTGSVVSSQFSINQARQTPKESSIGNELKDKLTQNDPDRKLRHLAIVNNWKNSISTEQHQSIVNLLQKKVNYENIKNY